jgi:hypothetical protein
MADAPAPNTTAAPPETAAPAPMPAPKRKGSAAGLIIQSVLLLIFFALVVVLQKVMLFALLAMLPSCIAWFIDKSPRKPVFFTVTAFNFAGFFPYFMQIMTSQSLAYATEEMLADIMAWLVIYGAAGVGWLLVLAGPRLSLALVDMYYGGQVMRMEKEKEILNEQWGIEEEQQEAKS